MVRGVHPHLVVGEIARVDLDVLTLAELEVKGATPTIEAQRSLAELLESLGWTCAEPPVSRTVEL